MRILLTGGAGALGQYMNIELAGEHDLLTIYNNNVGNTASFNSARCDITNHAALAKLFDEFTPDVVFHLATLNSGNSVDEKLVYDVNIIATKKIAELCDKHGSFLFFASTADVYNPDVNGFKHEASEVKPKTTYAKSKLEAECVIKSVFGNYAILRVALIYGFALNNATIHFHHVYNELKAGREVRLFTDQLRTPVSLLDAARLMNELLPHRDLLKGEYLNFGGREVVTRYDMAKIMCDYMHLNTDLMIKGKQSDIPNFITTTDLRLNTNKLQSLGLAVKTVEKSIVEHIRQL